MKRKEDNHLKKGKPRERREKEIFTGSGRKCYLSTLVKGGRGVGRN